MREPAKIGDKITAEVSSLLVFLLECDAEVLHCICDQIVHKLRAAISISFDDGQRFLHIVDYLYASQGVRKQQADCHQCTLHKRTSNMRQLPLPV